MCTKKKKCLCSLGSCLSIFVIFNSNIFAHMMAALLWYKFCYSVEKNKDCYLMPDVVATRQTSEATFLRTTAKLQINKELKLASVSASLSSANAAAVVVTENNDGNDMFWRFLTISSYMVVLPRQPSCLGRIILAKFCTARSRRTLPVTICRMHFMSTSTTSADGS